MTPHGAIAPGVEPVVGFCSPAQYLEYIWQAPELARMRVRSGIRLPKFWVSVARGQQRARIVARESDPLKMSKLSPIDKASLCRWVDFTKAKEAIFLYTDPADAPWVTVKSDDTQRAALNALRPFLSTVDCPGKDTEVLGHAGSLHRGRRG